MSRKNRRRNQRQKEQEKPKDPSRRKFVIGGIAALGAIAAPAIYILSCTSPNNDNWEFLRREVDINLPQDTWRYPVHYYVPLCAETEFNKEDKELEELIRTKMPAIRSETRRRGLKGENGLLGTEQHFGRPEEARFAEPYKEYLTIAIDYLYSRLPRLERVPLELVILKEGDNYSNNEEGKGFIGYSLHDVQRVHVTNEKTGEKFTVGLSINRDGAFVRSRFNKKGERENYFIFFGTGPMALSSAFSEIIPLTTSEVSASYLRKFGFDKYQVAEEALSEGISYLLTIELIKELNIPQGMEILDEIQRGTKKKSRYQLVPASIRWLKENGIEKGLELYMSDPEKFIKSIEG